MRRLALLLVPLMSWGVSIRIDVSGTAATEFLSMGGLSEESLTPTPEPPSIVKVVMLSTN